MILIMEQTTNNISQQHFFASHSTPQHQHQFQFKIGDTTQVGSFFDTNLNCFTEAQFYFTTIYIPCDYDKILTSQYGYNWRKVENRDRGSSKTETKVLSEEESNEILALGPRPVCAT